MPYDRPLLEEFDKRLICYFPLGSFRISYRNKRHTSYTNLKQNFNKTPIGFQNPMENLLNSCRKYFHPIGNIIPVGFLENSTGFQKYLEGNYFYNSFKSTGN